jgi:hypothetical protein
MEVRRGLACLGVLAALVVAPDAVAQYYPSQYYPAPYPPPGYYPPPAYRLGGRCNARVPTAYGPRRLICDLIRPRPVGRPCICPPPPPPPGYPPGPYLNGRVIP